MDQPRLRRPVSAAMQAFVETVLSPGPRRSVAPCDPCPCGSGRKLKRCCGNAASAERRGRKGRA